MKRLQNEGRLPQDRGATIIAHLTIGRLEYALARLVLESRAAAFRVSVEADDWEPLYVLAPRIAAACAELNGSSAPEDVVRIVSDRESYEEYCRIHPDEEDDDEAWDPNWERDHSAFRDELYLLTNYPRRSYKDPTPPWPMP